ncbi:MAG: 5'-nucleotidase, lipoprotein e(P4) family [Candidatus Cloacimonas sp. 4484_140]|nr:MAG: 5'-nucleotidase, lipoprotein e(P4) family [Candidatus Cloacimonas sp. 4484_140]
MKKYLIFCVIAVFLLSTFPKYKLAAEDGLNEKEYLMAALWQQTSSEYRALCYQAFNVARDRIHMDIIKEWPKPRAVIIDLDETVIFNAKYNATGVIREQEYPKEFYEWIASGDATPIPGAVEFLEFIDEEGYTIFYVTNRRDECTDITLQQILDLELPQANREHLLMRGTDHTKQGRRDKVNEDYAVILYIGDNCVDFLGDYYSGSIEERKNLTDSVQAEWGRKFIILPNPMHGSWKKALYHGVVERLSGEESLKHKASLLEVIE